MSGVAVENSNWKSSIWELSRKEYNTINNAIQDINSIYKFLKSKEFADISLVNKIVRERKEWSRNIDKNDIVSEYILREDVLYDKFNLNKLESMYKKYGLKNIELDGKALGLIVNSYLSDLNDGLISKEEFSEGVINSYFKVNPVSKEEVYNQFKEIVEKEGFEAPDYEHLLKEFKGSMPLFSDLSGEFIKFAEKIFRAKVISSLNYDVEVIKQVALDIKDKSLSEVVSYCKYSKEISKALNEYNSVVSQFYDFVSEKDDAVKKYISIDRVKRDLMNKENLDIIKYASYLVREANLIKGIKEKVKDKNVDVSIMSIYQKYGLKNIELDGKALGLVINSYLSDLEDGLISKEEFSEGVINSYFKVNPVSKEEVYNQFKEIVEKEGFEAPDYEHLLKDFKASVDNKLPGDFIKFAENAFKVKVISSLNYDFDVIKQVALSIKDKSLSEIVSYCKALDSFSLYGKEISKALNEYNSVVSQFYDFVSEKDDAVKKNVHIDDIKSDLVNKENNFNIIEYVNSLSQEAKLIEEFSKEEKGGIANNKKALKSLKAFLSKF